MSRRSDLAVLTAHGRSFRLAGRLLGRRMFRRAASLYAVCREIDDLADEAPDAELARAALLGLRGEIVAGSAATPLGRRLLALEVDRAASLMLVETMLSDLQPVRMADEAALLRYAHGAAGTVGVMMCDVLGVADPAARARAIELGIAMQLTNIARDVREDAARDRLYLPRDWLSGNAAPDSLFLDEAATYAAVQRLLWLAEEYYRNGSLGYAALPGRAALAIPVAARLYREIGVQILRTGACYLHRPRYVIPVARRIGLVAGCLTLQLAVLFGRGMPAVAGAEAGGMMLQTGHGLGRKVS